MAVYIGAMLGRLCGDARALRIDYKKGDDTMIDKRLNEKQIAAIEYLSLPKRGGMTFKQIAEEVGVSEQTIHRWRNDDVFSAALNRKIVRNTQDRLPELFDAAINGVIEEKNAALFRTLIQAHGLLTEKHEIDAKSNTGADLDEIKAQITRIRASKKDGD